MGQLWVRSLSSPVSRCISSMPKYTRSPPLVASEPSSRQTLYSCPFMWVPSALIQYTVGVWNRRLFIYYVPLMTCVTTSKHLPANFFKQRSLYRQSVLRFERCRAPKLRVVSSLLLFASSQFSPFATSGFTCRQRCHRLPDSALPYGWPPAPAHSLTAPPL